MINVNLFIDVQDTVYVEFTNMAACWRLKSPYASYNPCINKVRRSTVVLIGGVNIIELTILQNHETYTICSKGYYTNEARRLWELLIISNFVLDECLDPRDRGNRFSERTLIEVSIP